MAPISPFPASVMLATVLALFAPGVSSIANPSDGPIVHMDVKPTETRIHFAVAGGPAGLDPTSLVIRLAGSSNVAYLLVGLGAPYVTVELDKKDPDRFSLVLRADLTNYDLLVMVGDMQGRQAADWYLAQQGDRGPMGLHLVKEDFTNPAFDWQGALTRIKPGWVRVNALIYNNATWLARMQFIKSLGSKVLATHYASTGARVPWSATSLLNAETKIRNVVKQYAPYVDIWQLENELTANAKWNGQTSAQKGTGYANIFAPFHKAVRELDPTARAIPFGLPGGSLTVTNAFKSIFLARLKSLPGVKLDLIDMHYHTGYAVDSYAITIFNSVATNFSTYLGHSVQMVCTEGSTWEGDPAGFDPRQTGRQMARCAVGKQLSLAVQGSLFCGFGPLANRSTWKGSPIPHKFNLNGHYYVNGQPKLTAFSAERTNMLARCAGWNGFSHQKVGYFIDEITLTRGIKQPAGLVVWASGNRVYTVPKGFGRGVVYQLVVDQVGLRKPGILVSGGAQITVNDDVVYIEWLN